LREFAEILKDGLRGAVPVSAEQVNALQAHCEMLLRWNARINLTSVTGLCEVIERHYCESLFLGGKVDAGTWSIADIGSGGGFPGVPIAILRPECRVVLVESHQRKAVFLRESTRQLANVRVVAGRSEAIREVFDWVVSRAVAYPDLQPVLERYSRRAALLTGDLGPDDMPGYLWEERVELPWGKQRVLWLGRNPCFT
jgi:16S rRNA (guanine527-N7)-methyltransferase